jgi:putative Mg2+ transporter-C (MgtC) family protein
MLDLEWLETLREFNFMSVCVRLVLAMLIGGIIGIEREIRRHPAGLRTYILVCVGSAMVMMTNEYMNIRFGGLDPGRLGAQVISGIGFLGAGTILVTRHLQVRGLTTAAGLWASACIGLAVGIGFYEGAIVGTVIIFFTITIMHSFNTRLWKTSRSMEVFVELNRDSQLSDFLSEIIAMQIKVRHVEIVQARQGDTGEIAVILTLRMSESRVHQQVLTKLRQLKAAMYVEEI